MFAMHVVSLILNVKIRLNRNGHVVYYDRMNGANFKKMVALCSYDEIVR